MAAAYPNPPLKDWERADKLNVELIGYGWEEKRVVVRFHLPKDPDFQHMKLLVARMTQEVKHSKNWMCEFCGAPARESQVQNLSWHHLDPPRLIIYCHFVCDMDQEHVQKALTATHNTMNLLNGGRMGPAPTYDTFPKRPPGVVYPLGGSCACCQRDETAKDEGLKRCGACKLTRYCGAACQKKDWPRHKVACATIYSVAFENWD